MEDSGSSQQYAVLCCRLLDLRAEEQLMVFLVGSAAGKPRIPAKCYFSTMATLSPATLRFTAPNVTGLMSAPNHSIPCEVRPVH